MEEKLGIKSYGELFSLVTDCLVEMSLQQQKLSQLQVQVHNMMTGLNATWVNMQKVREYNHKAAQKQMSLQSRSPPREIPSIKETFEQCRSDQPESHMNQPQLYSDRQPESTFSYISSRAVDDNVSESQFDKLRETIYSEVATLISKNEKRPLFLKEVFHQLSQLNNDFLRQRVIFAIQDIVYKYIADGSEKDSDAMPGDLDDSLNKAKSSDIRAQLYAQKESLMREGYERRFTSQQRIENSINPVPLQLS